MYMSLMQIRPWVVWIDANWLKSDHKMAGQHLQIAVPGEKLQGTKENCNQNKYTRVNLLIYQNPKMYSILFVVLSPYCEQCSQAI